MTSQQGTESSLVPLDEQSEALLIFLIDLVNSAGYEVKITKLVKMLYFIDLSRTEKGLPQATNIDWVWGHYGPYSGAISVCEEKLFDEGEIERVPVGPNEDGKELHKLVTANHRGRYLAPSVMALATIIGAPLAATNTDEITRLSYASAPLVELESQKSPRWTKLDMGFPPAIAGAVNDLLDRLLGPCYPENDVKVFIEDNEFEREDSAMNHLTATEYTKHILSNLEDVSKETKREVHDLVAQISGNDSIFPFIEVDEDQTVLVYWISGRRSINIDVVPTAKGASYYFSIRRENEVGKSYVHYNGEELSEEVKALVRDELVLFTTFVSAQNSEWKKLYYDD